MPNSYSYYESEWEVTWRDGSTETYYTETSCKPENGPPRWGDRVKVQRLRKVYRNATIIPFRKGPLRGSYEEVESLNFENMRKVTRIDCIKKHAGVGKQ